MSILSNYKSELEKLNVALPFMEGREKIECKEFALMHKGEKLHINNLGFMELPSEETGELQTVAVITVKEDDKNFIFTGQAVTDILTRVVDIVGDDLDKLMEETLPIEMIVKKSKNKREYVSLKICDL